MPLANRVDPFKNLVATPHRGAWMGNRGVLLSRTGTFRPFTSEKRWIICTLEFKGRKRPLMQPGLYTELFFLDEVTALAAGHRPCFECRTEEAKHFRDLAGFKSFPELDAQLHAERFDAQPLQEDWQKLPNGAMISCAGKALLVFNEGLYEWSFDGYQPVNLAELKIIEASVLTPQTTIAVLKRGYPAQMSLTVSIY